VLQLVEHGEPEVAGEGLRPELEYHAADVGAGRVQHIHVRVGVEVLLLARLEHLQLQLLLVDAAGVVD
jgi:hypothetical protein